MNISVIVPAFNEEKLIAGSLASIKGACAAFEPLGWTTELIVCDNNSTDRTAELARKAGAAVVFEPVNQISRARNTGAAAAAGHWLIFVDADSHPTAELFAAAAQAIQTGRFIAGGSTIRLDHASWKARFGACLWNAISRLCRWCAGSFIFCEASAFRAVGGFSLELFASEELDLSKKLKRLARRQGRQLIILHDDPMRTSARKISLYTRKDALRFMARFCRAPQAALRSRETCAPWYDGRR